MRLSNFCLCLVAVWSASAIYARADDCGPLQRVTSVDLVPSDDTRQEYVPVTLMGKPQMFLLDTGGSMSEILPKTADELGLTRQRAPIRQYGVSNDYSDYFVSASFIMGRLKADHFDMMVAPDTEVLSDDPRVTGVLAPNLLRHFDIDIDFGTNKLNVLSQDHCAGKVVYWSADAVAVVPITVFPDGHILARVKLDGHSQYALLDTGAWNTTVTDREAESTYDLKFGSTDTPQTGAFANHPELKLYEHQFKSLEFEGISVANPVVEIIPDVLHHVVADSARPPIGSLISDSSVDESRVTMLIGMNVLRHFHLYIAYKEEKLYITPASAPAAATPTAATPAAQPAH